MRIVVLFNLKPGVAAEDYEAWARSRDIPGIRSMPSIDACTVHRTTSLLGSDGTPPFDYVEIIDVADIEGFQKDFASDTATEIGHEFREWLDGEPLFMMTEELSLA